MSWRRTRSSIPVADLECPFADPLHVEALIPGRPVGHVVGLEGGLDHPPSRLRRPVAGAGAAARIARRRSSIPAPLTEETARTPRLCRGPSRLAAIPRRRPSVGIGHQVGLREHDELGQALKSSAVLGELGAHRRVRGRRIIAADVTRWMRRLHRSDVGEELVTQSDSPRRTLDQARDVGDHELSLVGVERPEHRLQGRERILGDLRRCPRQAAQER